MASFPNVYTHRKVADTASKSCEICYKPSTSVLVTPENASFVNVDVDLKFNHPVKTVNAVFNGMAAGTGNGMNPDKTEYRFKAGQLVAQSLTFIIKSQEKIYTHIAGVDGMVKR